MTMMKKLCILLLAFAFLLALASWTRVPDETQSTETTTASSTSAQATPEVTTTATPPLAEAENPITYMNIYCTGADGILRYVSFSARDGGFDLEYQGDVKKVAPFEGESSAFLDAAFLRSALADFNGQSVYGGDGAYVSMYVQFEDNTYVTADFSGTIPESFLTGYQIMESEVAAFMQNVPIYVPKPLVIGNVNADALAEIEAIVKSADYAAPDGFYISDIPLDEFFEMKTGLSSKEGIVNATELGPCMQPSAFSLLVVTVEDETLIETVQKDFASDIPWNKWVCVSASRAVIAQKGNMVLFLLDGSNLYESTVTALTKEGWTLLETLTNRP